MGSQPVFITRGWIYFFPSLNDKDDKNDKESENSPMNLIGRGLWKPCHCCHGRVERAALCPPTVPDRHTLYGSRRLTDGYWICAASVATTALLG